MIELQIIDWEATGRDFGLADQAEAIFWQTARRGLPPGPERDAFRERWLGRYMQGGSDAVLLALAGPGVVAGYLVGALEDPARQSRFDDLGYFRSDFAHLTARFPAHLHINMDARFRSMGVGARLVEAFTQRAAHAGVPGIHVVTGKGMRNVRFYNRCGFVERAAASWNGSEIVFLGREIMPR